MGNLALCEVISGKIGRFGKNPKVLVKLRVVVKSSMETFWHRLTEVHLVKWPLTLGESSSKGNKGKGSGFI